MSKFSEVRRRAGCALSGLGFGRHGPCLAGRSDRSVWRPWGNARSEAALYFAALGTLGAALFCFFKAFRGFSADLPFSTRSKRNEAAEPAIKAKPARKVVEKPEDRTTDFDVDAAFSRYMSKRESNPETASQKADASPAAPARTGFGRKGL